MIDLVERPLAILLVDDDPERESLARRLRGQSQRYRVRHVLSLSAALAALESERFDVVLCDYVLGGGETARPIVEKVVASGTATRVVVFSGVEEGDPKEELLEAGAFWYLSKPLVFKELVHTIKTIEAFNRESQLKETSTKLADISSRLQSTLLLDEVVQRAVNATLELGFRRARIYLFDEERQRLVCRSTAGMEAGDSLDFAIDLGGSRLIDLLFERREPAAWNYESSRGHAKPADLEWIKKMGLEDVPWLDCPLLVGDQRVGTLAMDCKGARDPSLTPQQKETSGVLAGMVAQAVHNCRLHQAEARSRASLSQLLLEAPGAVVTTTLDGTIDFVSPSAEEILGFSSTELLRKKTDDIFAQPGVGLGPGATVARAIMKQLRSGERVANWPVCVRGAGDGLISMNMSASLLHGRSGEEVGAIIFLKPTGPLEMQVEKYRSLLEGFGYGTMLLDTDQSISFVSRKAERLLGRSSTELEGRIFSDLLRPGNQAQFNKLLLDVKSRPSEETLRIQWSVQGREVVPLQLVVSELRVGSSPTGFAVGIYDRREEERLLWTGRLAALGEMVGALAHEINNPLQVIQIALAELRDIYSVRSPEVSMERYLGHVQKSTDRIDSLVQRLRRLSRSEGHQPTETDLCALIDGFLDFFSARLARSDVRVSWERPRVPAMILADSSELEQVLTSLLVNAEEAMVGLSSKQVFIELALSIGGSFEVAIEDSGSGVPAVHREEIFDLFFTSKPKRGTGFGLSISRAIAREHGGDLRLSEPLHGCGARFVLELPEV